MVTMTTMTTLAAPPVEAPTAEPEGLRMSFDEYMQLDHEGRLVEWVDGEVIFHMPPFDEHQRMVEFLDRLIGLFVEMFNLGLLRITPFTMQATPGGPAREPDLLFIETAHLDRVTRQGITGPADLAIEIVSADSVSRDRADKFYEYQDAGIREYWILDPRPGRERADFYVLDAQGRYQPIPIASDGTYHSTVLSGFWLRVQWLWVARPMPLQALAEIVGEDRVIAALRQSR